jgi:hypothetical protein
MATFVHGITANLTLAGQTLAGVLTSADQDLQRELAEIKAMGATNVARVAGLRNTVLTGGGAFDATIDAALFTAYDSAAVSACIFTPNGTITYTLNVFISSYKITAASNGAVSWTVNLASDGDVARA